jgi:hypothetical protein
VLLAVTGTTLAPDYVNAQPVLNCVFTPYNSCGTGYGGAGSQMTLTGLGFTKESKVFVGGIEQVQISSQTNNEIVLTLGSVRDGTIVVCNGGLCSNPLNFIAIPLVGDPLIYDFEPKQLPRGNATTLVYIYGGNFTAEVNEVRIGGQFRSPHCARCHCRVGNRLRNR